MIRATGQPEVSADAGTDVKTIGLVESRPERRLRVLLFTNSIGIGGMEKHVEMIAHDLDRRHVEVYAICPEWELIDPWAEKFCRLADASARITPDRRYGWAGQMREFVHMWRQLRAWHIDVMHMHLTSYHGGTWALLAARLAGVRTIICTEHLAPSEHVPLLTGLWRRAFTHNLDGIVSVSELNYEARASHLYTPKAKSVVVNNGIDLTDYTPIAPEVSAALRAQLGIPAGAPVVGTVVRFVEEKGLPYLMEAMPRVLAQAPETRLLLVGDGPLRNELTRQAEALGYADKVIFAGFQSDPRPYLSLMNAFVLPVPFGSASIGLLEAMAMRRAVVITFGGNNEAVIDGETGLRPPPRDPVALGNAILRIVLDPEFERTLGTRARQRIEAAFSSQSVAAQLLDLYERKYGPLPLK